KPDAHGSTQPPPSHEDSDMTHGAPNSITPMPRCRLRDMANTIRRPRGTGTHRVALYVEVDPEIKEAFAALADQTGASKWALIEAMITRAQADMAAGRGDWLPRPNADQDPLLTD